MGGGLVRVSLMAVGCFLPLSVATCFLGAGVSDFVFDAVIRVLEAKLALIGHGDMRRGLLRSRYAI